MDETDATGAAHRAGNGGTGRPSGAEPGTPDPGSAPVSKRAPREIDTLTARVEGLHTQVQQLLHALRAFTLIILGLLLILVILRVRRRGVPKLAASTPPDIPA